MTGRVGAAVAAAVLSVAAAGAVRGQEQEQELWDHHGRVPGAGAAAAPQATGGSACGLAGADRARTPSASCMACHDGSAAPGVSFRMGRTAQSMDHPVEVSYLAAAARDPRHYLPEAALPPEIPLVNGKVACTSCHDGASPDPKRVVRVARLCESCHDM